MDWAVVTVVISRLRPARSNLISRCGPVSPDEQHPQYSAGRRLVRACCTSERLRRVHQDHLDEIGRKFWIRLQGADEAVPETSGAAIEVPLILIIL